MTVSVVVFQLNNPSANVPSVGTPRGHKLPITAPPPDPPLAGEKIGGTVLVNNHSLLSLIWYRRQ